MATLRSGEFLRRVEEAGSSAPAAIATLLAGFVIGAGGFLRFAIRAASENDDAMLAVARRQQDGSAPGPEVTTASSVALTALAPLQFVVGTPLGWLSTYLLVTGLYRAVAAAVGERRGEPVAGAVLTTVRRKHRARRAAREEAARLALEGPEVADRLVPGERVGIADAPLVVVASRRKPDWTPGTVLACGDRFFQVLDAVDRQLPTGLRALYPIEEVAGAAVFRRVVPYTLPPLTEVRPVDP